MKREILFKAKRIDNGEWVEGYYVLRNKTQNGVIWIENENVFTWVDIDKDSVCQFTGLLDKNGNKIFEGDKVSFIDYGYKTAYVKFNNRNHSFVLTYPSYHNNHTKLTGRGKLEIIGNIHDNEL